MKYTEPAISITVWMVDSMTRQMNKLDNK